LLFLRCDGIIREYAISVRGENTMSRKSQLSGKGPMSGNTRSHALNSTRRKWNLNLQKVTIMVDGKPTKVKMTARELRTLRKGA